MVVQSTQKQADDSLALDASADLDKRLVRTFVSTIVAILSFRGNGQALQLSELGAYLPGEAREPAKTKMVQRLLMSKKWSKRVIEVFLWQRATTEVQRMKAVGERPLCIWDGSVARYGGE
jgi:hypothetical protein